MSSQVLTPRIGYSVAETATMLDMNEKSVRSAIAAGQIPAETFGRRILVPAAFIRKMLGGEVPTKAAESDATSGDRARVPASR